MMHHYAEEDPEEYEMQRHYRHGVEDEEGASWRDDKYHDHAGFDLRRSHDTEMDHRGIEHESIGHYNDVLEHEVAHERHESRYDGVEHFDNEREHQAASSSKKGPTQIQFNYPNGGGGCNWY